MGGVRGAGWESWESTCSRDCRCALHRVPPSFPPGLVAEPCFLRQIGSKTSHRSTSPVFPVSSGSLLPLSADEKHCGFSLVPSQGCRWLTLSPRAPECYSGTPLDFMGTLLFKSFFQALQDTLLCLAAKPSSHSLEDRI